VVEYKQPNIPPEATSFRGPGGKGQLFVKQDVGKQAKTENRLVPKRMGVHGQIEGRTDTERDEITAAQVNQKH